MHIYIFSQWGTLWAISSTEFVKIGHSQFTIGLTVNNKVICTIEILTTLYHYKSSYHHHHQQKLCVESTPLTDDYMEYKLEALPNF